MRVVIAADLVLLRDGIARALQAHGIDVVGEVGDAGALVEAVTNERPDLIIVDVRMPPGFSDEVPERLGSSANASRDSPCSYFRIRSTRTSHSFLRRNGRRGTAIFSRTVSWTSSGSSPSVRTVAAGGTVVDPDVIERGLARRHTPVETPHRSRARRPCRTGAGPQTQRSPEPCTSRSARSTPTCARSSSSWACRRARMPTGVCRPLSGAAAAPKADRPADEQQW